MEIRELSKEEKPLCRKLWEEAFPEDSGSFTDYYFREKLKDNRVVVLQENGKFLSMLHRNPYRLIFGGEVCVCDYLVGVATKASGRRRGYMRILLDDVLSCMEQEGMPFCFLMPANEKIYLPFGFSYIYRQQKLRWKEEAVQDCRAGYNEQDSKTAAEWINHCFSDRYEVYALRDEAYMKRLWLEMQSEDGRMEWILREGRHIGLTGEWGLVQKEQRLFYYLHEKDVEVVEEKPSIMARILNLSCFLKAVRLQEECIESELEISLFVRDEIVTANNGHFRWHLNHDTSWIEQSQDASSELTLSIGEMTAWLFGFCIPKQAEPYRKTVRPIQGVILDEIV